MTDLSGHAKKSTTSRDFRRPAADADGLAFRQAATVSRVHSASTGRYSLILVHPERGTAAMDTAGVLPAFAGVVVLNPHVVVHAGSVDVQDRLAGDPAVQ
ncbi:hypothetical protein [Streptomyces sp. SID13031]|uniref:hypothetical protein n=1 Tax=Streptomyces sp. SID13031 TaxID=2706046 RepID=UPI0013C8692E|nr:hypothetical protein [Streptomyces sp. SID13031]NEA32924.1 hypothetical protein [Streptomyces sp. SID13031]